MSGRQLSRTAVFAVATLLIGMVVLGGCANTPPNQSDTAKPEANQNPPPVVAETRRVLILSTPLPPGVEFERIGRISVYKRSFGGTGQAFRMLGDKGRELGANAVIESSVRLKPAFPVMVAPHGWGTAVRVKNETALEEIGKSSGRWE